jgi:hypothetical protein
MARAFATMLDVVIGPKHWSWQSFRRSTILSTIFATLLIFYVAVNRSEVAASQGWIAILVAAINALVLSAVPNYLSIFKTRRVIDWLRSHRGIRYTVVALVLDLIGSALVGFTPQLLLAILVLVATGGDIAYVLKRASEIVPEVIAAPFEDWPTSRDPSNMWLAIYYYSSFVSSVWLWMFIASAGIIRLSGIAQFGVVRFRWWYEEELQRKPFEVLGVGASIAVSIGFALGLLVGVIRQLAT